MKVGDFMKQKEMILEIAKKNRGILTTRQVSEASLSRSNLLNLVKSEKLHQVQRGIYVMEDVYVDDFFLQQQRFKTGIYSHETALYLLGYSDRVPQVMTMTFKHGRSTVGLVDAGIKPVMTSHHLEMGVVEVERNGFPIRVYDIERTLVDLMKGHYDTDKEQFIPALKKYVVSKNRNFNKLYQYAQAFGQEKPLQQYMEVLV